MKFTIRSIPSNLYCQGYIVLSFPGSLLLVSRTASWVNFEMHWLMHVHQDPLGQLIRARAELVQVEVLSVILQNKWAEILQGGSQLNHQSKLIVVSVQLSTKTLDLS